MKTTGFFLLAAFSVAAHASGDGLVLRCDAQNKELVLEHLLDKEPPSFWQSDRNHVRFRDLLEVEPCAAGRANAGDACTVRETKTAVRACEIGGSSFSVSLTPQPFNYNLQGYCGARVTGTVEVRKDGQLVLGPTLLDPNQDCASDSLQLVKSVRIRLDEPRPTVTYGPR